MHDMPAIRLHLLHMKILSACGLRNSSAFKARIQCGAIVTASALGFSSLMPVTQLLSFANTLQRRMEWQTWWVKDDIIECVSNELQLIYVLDARTDKPRGGQYHTLAHIAYR